MIEKKYVVISFFSLLLFVLVTEGMYAQQTRFFFNPRNPPMPGHEVIIPMEINPSYTYYKEIRNPSGEPIVRRTRIDASQLRERFITSVRYLNPEGGLSLMERLEIRWDGFEGDPSDRRPYDDGEYQVIIYQISRVTGEVRDRFVYFATIDTTIPDFRIELDSDTIFRNRVPLVVHPTTERAFLWSVEIRAANEIIFRQTWTDTENREELPFPGFTWNGYAHLGQEDQFLTLIIRARDLAGNEAEPQVKPFRLTNYIETAVDFVCVHCLGLAFGGGDSDLGLFPDIPLELHIVRRGEYLARIVREKYGSAFFYGLIYELNRNAFPVPGRPALIRPGMELQLPSIDFLNSLIDAVQQEP